MEPVSSSSAGASFPRLLVFRTPTMLKTRIAATTTLSRVLHLGLIQGTRKRLRIGAPTPKERVSRRRLLVVRAEQALLGVLDARDPGDRRYDQAGAIERPRPDCVAGHVGLELRNVVANYPLERPRRFPGFQPSSGHRDHSRLSCGAGDTHPGLVLRMIDDPFRPGECHVENG